MPEPALSREEAIEANSRMSEAHEAVFRATADYIKYRRELPPNLTVQERKYQLDIWFKGAGSVCMDQIEATHAYPENNEYADDGASCLITFMLMIVKELPTLVPKSMVGQALLEIYGDGFLDTLQSMADYRKANKEKDDDKDDDLYT